MPDDDMQIMQQAYFFLYSILIDCLCPFIMISRLYLDCLKLFVARGVLLWLISYSHCRTMLAFDYCNAGYRLYSIRLIIM